MTILPAQFYCYRPGHSVKISQSVSQIRGLAFLYETPFLEHLQAASEIRRWRCVRSPSKALFESGTQTLLRLLSGNSGAPSATCRRNGHEIEGALVRTYRKFPAGCR